ncbi:hypothetical protein BDA99DRAFT_1952 [Phascolomyces articulosus]|uniref:ER membrane protein complex subunit 10 n=1 Tax=Phascolomyces articulosus TaxID=60185 RepID=A0AAD5PJ42_9FUNG|nr:hypothetical protein BDA99DRAFT_1952 [Phascolomyces articulosus]
MRVSFFLNVLIALSIIAIAAATEEIKLHVYHKQGADYKKRGEIIGLPNAPSYVATAKDDTIELNSLLYQVKIRDETTDRIILSSIKACQLVDSGWKDEFRVHFDDEKKVYHVDYYAQTDACDSDIELPYKAEPKFATRVFVERPVAGAKPFLGQYGKQNQQQAQQVRQQAQQGQVQGKEGGEEEFPIEEEKTFFQKYWYLVLGGALVLINAMNAPPESGPAPRR